MGLSYLTSLNPQLFKNIAYVGSFKHFSVQLFFTYILQFNQDQCLQQWSVTFCLVFVSTCVSIFLLTHIDESKMSGRLVLYSFSSN